ncbi:MAG: TRAP transporter substrate-binding protein [Pseudomonadota bacterium]
MSNRKFIAGVAFAGIAGLALASAAAEAQSLRLAHHHAVGGTVDKTANKFADLVKEKTGGKLIIAVFPAAQLGQEVEAFGLMNQGVIDATITSLGHMDKFYPPMGVTSLPFIFRDWAHAYRAFDGEFGKTLTAGMLEKSNAHLIGYIGLGFRDMIFRGDPVTEADRMKGLKMRSPESHVWIRMFQLLGARPTPVTWGEVYTAMQTGVAEGLESPAMAALDMKFNEVTKSVVRTRHMFATMAITINKSRLGRLPADQQGVILAAGREAAIWSNTTISEPGEAEAYKAMTTKGMRVFDAANPPAWAEAVKPLWEELASKDAATKKAIDILVATK